MNTKIIKKTTIGLLALVLISSSCSTLKKLTREQKGAAIGIGTGAAAGAAIGSKSKNPAVYAIVGSAVGGVAGAIIGKYMDKQAKELEDKLGNIAEVERIEEGIKVTMKSGILFAFNSSELSSESKKSIQDLANTLIEYPNTDILVAGYTDNIGTEAYNLKLSERRAKAVSSLLNAYNVKSSRLVVKGYGESNPAYSNDSEEGQEKNRRVELAIVADNNLKKSAKKETSLSLK
ncbi:OmpA family protein [Lacihabitans sp. LS3-19]|uniref:OmpA family protein n=1 Tax=Lacihabitans sp. LS3-19 TaxID=2487335 RepID=UPI0020CDEBBD|nr:OmpA family protein [Lacihabitans sp. LS3-19]